MPDLIKTKIQVARLWLRVEQGAFLDKVLPELRHQEYKSDLGEFLLRGMLDHKLELLWAANQVYPRFDNFPQIMRAILLLSIFQLRYTEVPAPLVVSEAVNAVRQLKLGRLTGAANSGLRKQKLCEQPVESEFVSQREYLSVKTSLPTWILEQLEQDYPEVDPIQIAKGYRASRQSFLRRVRDRWSVQQLQEEATTSGVVIEQTSWNEFYYRLPDSAPANIPAVRRGDMVVHDVSASAAVELLDAGAGDRVLDCCAAPGGKLRQLLEMQAQLKVIAVEKDGGRLRAMQRLVPRDERVQYLQKDLMQIEPEPFDHILLDVPCSGSGNYGKKPDSRYRRGVRELEQLLQLQQQLLSKAATMLKPGGRLVYSTCSLFKCENERQVERFLNEQSEFQLVLEPVGNHPQTAPGMVKYTPWEHQTGGAFAAVLTRTVK